MTILATRLSFNDPNIVDVLIKPDGVSDGFAKNVNDHISKDQVIMHFLTAVHSKTVEFESKMYKTAGRSGLLSMLRIVHAVEHYHQLYCARLKEGCKDRRKARTQGR